MRQALSLSCTAGDGGDGDGVGGNDGGEGGEGSGDGGGAVEEDTTLPVAEVP